MRQRLGTEDAFGLDAASTADADAMLLGDRRGSASRGWLSLRDRADVPGSKLAFDVDRIDGSGSSSSDASTFGVRSRGG
ncbi:hypothetical protein SEA_SAGEFIRE_89 [Mycobacterium phage Sagefire]|nr:hypothetical protein SEA_SAGEFIRE_89 [Mycobacterium phage Sagefire]